MKVERRCDVCNRMYVADTRNLNRGWGLCCSKSCAALKRERKIKPDTIMKKELFVKQLTQVIELDQKCKKIATLVNDLFCEGSVASVVDFHYPVTESHIENIATLSGIDKEEIEAFLWDNDPCYTKYTKDGVETKITTPEELWYYLKAD